MRLLPEGESGANSSRYVMQLINECLSQAFACFSYPSKLAMMDTMCIDEAEAMKTETPEGSSDECLSDSEASSGTDYETERHSDGDVCFEGYSSPSSSHDQVCASPKFDLLRLGFMES